MPFSAAELEERRKFLGASEAPAALGLSPYFTALELYNSKEGIGEAIEETLPMMVGVALEPVTIAWFEKKSGLKVTDRQLVVYDKRNPWRRATLDGKASNGWIVEAKSSGQWLNWGADLDAVPAPILYQAAHQMACDVEAPGVYVPVILGQRQYRLYEVERDAELIALTTEGEQAFMDRLRTKNPPAPVNHDDLKLLYPIDVGKTITATPYIERVAYDLASTKAEIKVREKLEESQAFEIKEFMKDAAVLVDSKGKPLFTYKANMERRMEVSEFRKDHPQLADAYSPEKAVRKLLNKIKL